MKTTTRRCEACGGPITRTRNPRARYCGAACKQWAYYQRRFRSGAQ